MDTEGHQQASDHRTYGMMAPLAGILLFAAILAVMLGLSDIFIN